MVLKFGVIPSSFKKARTRKGEIAPFLEFKDPRDLQDKSWPFRRRVIRVTYRIKVLALEDYAGFSRAESGDFFLHTFFVTSWAAYSRFRKASNGPLNFALSEFQRKINTFRGKEFMILKPLTIEEESMNLSRPVGKRKKTRSVSLKRSENLKGLFSDIEGRGSPKSIKKTRKLQRRGI